MKRRLAGIVLAAALVLAGCGAGKEAAPAGTAEAAPEAEAQETEQTEETAEAVSGGTFVYGISTEIDNLDPVASVSADTKSIYFNIYEGLLKVTTDGSFAPAIAESYTVDDEAKVYTFTLRDGVKFHNGQEVTPEDVIYSLQLYVDAGTNGFTNVDTMEATGEKEVTVTLKEGSTDFPAAASAAIVPAGSNDNGELAHDPIGTGPFKLTDFVFQDHLTLTRFDDYWGTLPSLDTVEVRFISNSSDFLMNFQSGAIDGFTANAGITEQLDKEAVNLFVNNSNAVQLLALNNAKAPFDNPLVRQAVSYAVDSDEIIDTVNYGYGVKIGSALIPGLSAYYDESLAGTYDRDTEKAKALLAEAGLPDGFTFTVRVPSVYQVHVDTAQVIVNQLADIGVTMKIEQVDWGTWLEKVYTNRDFEATIVSLDGSIASPTAFLNRYQSDSPKNFINFQSADYDEAYQAAVSSVDEEARRENFKRCQQIITEEAASVYIQDISNILVYSRGFDGYAGYPLYAVDFSVIHRTEE